jgi:hypothetical protein
MLNFYLSERDLIPTACSFPLAYLVVSATFIYISAVIPVRNGMELFNCHEVENTVIDNRANGTRLMHGKKNPILRTI